MVTIELYTTIDKLFYFVDIVSKDYADIQQVNDITNYLELYSELFAT